MQFRNKLFSQGSENCVFFVRGSENLPCEFCCIMLRKATPSNIFTCILAILWRHILLYDTTSCEIN